MSDPNGPSRHQFSLVLLLWLGPMACGGGGGATVDGPDAAQQAQGADGAPIAEPDARVAAGAPDAAVAGGAVARVEIAPRAILLTTVGQTRTLAARAFDAKGDEIAAAVTWTSSRPEDIAVGADGRLTGKRIGSAQIVATAAGVRSGPALVAVVETAAGAVLVSDAQVVAVEAPVLAPGGLPGVGARYDVRLTGVAPVPAPGTVMLASEAAPVAGRVVATRMDGDALVATLELVPLHELLSAYHLDWSLDLSAYEIVAVAPGPAKLPDDDAIQPFKKLDCEGEVKFKLFRQMIDFGVENKLTLDLKNDKDPGTPPGYSKLSLSGSLALTGTAEIGINANVTLTGTCIANAMVKLPIFGWVSYVLMPAVRLGAGVELEGKLTVATAILGVTGKVGLNTQFGWECGPAPLPCRSVAPPAGQPGPVSPLNELKPKVEIPSIHQMRIDASGQFFVLAGLDLTFLGGAGGNFAIAEVRVGPKQSASKIAFEDDQAHEADTRSSYDLALLATLQPGSGLKAAIKKVIDDDAVGVSLEAEFKHTISESPNGSFAVDKTRVGLGKKVKLTVELDPRTVDYFQLGYNVDSIHIRRRKDGEDTYEEMPALTIVVRASNQTHFEVEWTPTEADAGTNELAAFVRTTLPILPDLEVADDSRKKVQVLAYCPPAGGPGKLPAVACMGTVKHTLTETVAGIGATTHTATAQVELVRESAEPNTGLYVLRPKGTFTYERTGTLGPCALRIAPTSGTIPAAPFGGAVFLYTSDEQILYDGLIDTGGFTVSQVLTCPSSTTVTEIPSWDFPLFDIPHDGQLMASPDGMTLHGTYTVDLGTVVDVWEWDLRIE